MRQTEKKEKGRWGQAWVPALAQWPLPDRSRSPRRKARPEALHSPANFPARVKRSDSVVALLDLLLDWLQASVQTLCLPGWLAAFHRRVKLRHPRLRPRLAATCFYPPVRRCKGD